MPVSQQHTKYMKLTTQITHMQKKKSHKIHLQVRLMRTFNIKLNLKYSERTADGSTNGFRFSAPIDILSTDLYKGILSTSELTFWREPG